MINGVLIVLLLAIIFAIGSQFTKIVFCNALKNPAKVKIKDKLLINITNDERTIRVIEKVLIRNNYKIITSDISRAMYSVSPLIAKIYENFVGVETLTAIKSANEIFKKNGKDIET
jgi:hypothetical protein